MPLYGFDPRAHDVLPQQAGASIMKKSGRCLEDVHERLVERYLRFPSGG